jgi:hypothetical protein
MKDEWTAEERSRLSGLPMSRMPTDAMKRRTIEAARAAGYVQIQTRTSGARVIARLAAATMIFAAGITVGYVVARRATPASTTTSRSTNHATVASMQGLTITTAPKGGIVWY